jgi:uncharacterized protein YbjT (DUF2867 family)
LLNTFLAPKGRTPTSSQGRRTGVGGPKNASLAADRARREMSLPDSGYLRAKMAQESPINGSKIPYTIVRSTQFFEFLNAITQSGTVGQTVRLSPALLQPIGSDDGA